MSNSPVPEGYSPISPYLSIDGAAAAIEFYQRAFGASVTFRLEAPNGQVAHAELRIGEANIMLADGCDTWEQFRTPTALGGSPVGIHLYVDDVDSLFAQAIAAGAREVKPPQDQFYGDRNGTLVDPFGHLRFLSTRVESLSHEEVRQRAAELFGQKQH